MKSPLPEIRLLKPTVYADSRGYFFECHGQATAGMPAWLQSNLSRSSRGVLRGLHLQRQQPQAKLMSVVRGAIFDVAVDVRPASPTFGNWCGHYLNDQNHHQVYVPVGFAHGFCVLSEEADILYQCSDYYHPTSEVCLVWNDPQVAIEWPVVNPILSPKDAQGYRLTDLA